MNRFLSLAIILFVILMHVSCIRYFSETPPEPVVPLAGYKTLDKFPFKEGWYGMYFQEDKVGYSHFKIEPEGENFQIINESFMRLTAMKKSNEIKLNEKVRVRPDLSLISFESEVWMNDKKLEMKGTTQADQFLLELAVEGEKLNREYPLEGRIYHSSAISLMPAMRGLKDGEQYSFKVFNVEKQGIEKIDQTINAVKGSPGPSGAAWKVKNNYGNAIVYSWLDKMGRIVIEKALDGALITVLEDETAARKFAEKKSPGKDLILDFSLIKIPKPIPNPEKLRFLKVKMQSIDKSLIPEDHRQSIIPAASSDPNDFFVQVTVEDLRHLRMKKYGTRGKNSSAPSDEDLAPTISIQSNHPEIVAKATEIVEPKDAALVKINKLVRWTSQNIKNKMKDSFTALSVLRSKEGECQAHANLYVALARSQRIPTRVITGIVYSEKIGFLYHAWAESYAENWIAVDPTMNQVPADATHIKIYIGDATENTPLLMRIVGKLKLEVIEYH